MARHPHGGTRSFGILFGLGLGLLIVACSGGGGDTGGGGGGGTTEQPTNQTPQTEAQVTSPSTNIQVTASISASTLGDECGNAKGSFAAGDCAPTPPGEAGKGNLCGGGGGCQQSNVQIAFSASAQGSSAAKIEIVQVTLHDDGGTQLATLTSSSPKSWNGSSYAAWDQTIAPSAKIKASYDLTAPDWAKISPNGTRYDTKYRLRVSLRIDGVSILLESTVLNREPNVAT